MIDDGRLGSAIHLLFLRQHYNKYAQIHGGRDYQAAVRAAWNITVRQRVAGKR